ncbi:MAG: hypothetical protein M1840_008156 [Geoglossum simile]|nr:MAG: hypothetical protein M1840_008156 [Geoglossum simile]
MRPYSPSSCPSSGLLPDRSRASLLNQLSREDRLHTSRSVTDEYGLVRPVLHTDTFDEERQQQEGDHKGGDNDEDNQPQQKVNNVAAVLMTERVGNTHVSSKGDESARPAKRQQPLPYGDSSPEPSHDEAGSHSDNYSDDELNNTEAKLDEDDERPRPAKRKRPFSSCDGPTQQKYKNHLQYRSSC